MMRKILGSFIIVTALLAAVLATVPDQPYMESALADLNKAKSELAAALRNKGGHRAKAAALVNQAISETKAGIAFARTHNHTVFTSADQPHMQAVLDALNNAKNNLDQATPDKGGHRAKASI